MNKAPDSAIAGVTPGWERLRIVDASTGEAIERVVQADALAGTLTRTAVDEAGNLKRENDAFVLVEERRAIRIEWIDQGSAPAIEPTVDSSASAVNA